ncbi:GNAT family N-acetyltransferase [Saccharopolyspora hordei]|uniref:RimJ/RimL family protein N-acetyltransferase n=1 Tax=Saccharopolyspora hordei TaxID=1838 RepID=A0A853ANF2_9PSEU|nr:RimJ/RimL family protein N-acetyltransferase [Saccharopolyspora hordei]
MRLRGIEPADRRTLIGFDRESLRDGPPQFDGYRHWAAHRADHIEPGEDLHLAIETRHDRTLVGSLSTSQPKPGTFSYGIGIGPQHRRRGYADDAITTLLAYMFGHRRFRKCEVGIYGSNTASLALHRRLGFREEGRLHDPQFLCGGAQDLVVMGITAEEFASHQLSRTR